MTKLEENRLVSFDLYQLTGQHGQVLRDNRPLALSPKAVAVLWVLVSRAGQVVSKDELFAEVWPETVVSEGVLTNCIHGLRQALGDATAKPRYIETVSRRGYRFITPLTTSRPAGLASSVQSLESAGQKAASPIPTPDPRRQTLVPCLASSLAVYWGERCPRRGTYADAPV